MTDSIMGYSSLLFAAAFIYYGFQVRSGNLESLGGIGKNIRPEYKRQFCKEISLPMLLVGVVEGIDAIAQLLFNASDLTALIILGTGVILAMLWMYLVVRKYRAR